MQEKRGLLARLGSLMRWLLLAVLVCAAGLVVFRQLVIARLDEQIRLRVEAMFADHYTDMDVQIQAARRMEGQGIELRGFSLRSSCEETARRELLYIDEMFLQCQTDLRDLLSGNPNVQRLIIRRMKVRATCHQDGKWNVACLLPLPDFGGTVPVMELEDSTIELQDLCRQTGGVLALHDIDMRVRIDRDKQGARIWQLAGSLLGDHFKRVKLEGLVDAQRGRWSAWGTIDGLEMSQRLLDAMPNDVAKYLSVLATLRARARFRVSCGA